MSTAPPAQPLVDVWSVELARAVACERRMSAALSGDERARADRFVRSADRLRYRVAHGALRTILGRCTGAEPAELRFAHGEHGKPLLAGGPHFSLSHSGDVVLVAVSRESEVGVDVEEVRPVAEARELARRYLAPAPARRIADAHDAQRDRRFIAAWTAIEAICKAEGTGLAGAEQPLDLRDLDEERIRATIAGRGDSPAWTVRRLAPAAGHLGAVAVRAEDLALRMHRFA